MREQRGFAPAREQRGFAVLDDFRLLAALLVVTIHTSPLSTYHETADFLLTRVFARVAVPFFFMVTGYFLAKDGWRGTQRFWKRTLLLYGAAIVLYIPLNIYMRYMGAFSWYGLARSLLFDGTLYHLWYFPALLLGVPLAKAFSKLGLRAAIPLAGVLYLIGLGGDSYYGGTALVPVLKGFYDGMFHVFSYTRNGLFFAPLFLLLGAAGRKWRPGISMAGFCLSMAVMAGEALWLRRLGTQRHDSMYLFLPICMVFLFSLLLSNNQGRNQTARRVSLLIYLLHPWTIVLIRGAAKLLHLEQWLIVNSLGHFLAVMLCTAAGAALLCAIRPQRLPQNGRAWRELDLDALRHNARVLQAQLAPGCKLMAVVKADAYGHGAVPVARALRREGIRNWAVACIAEAVILRKAGIRGTVLILGYTPPSEARRLARWRLTQTVLDADYARALSAQGRRLHVHLSIDTGMHRFGMPAEDTETIKSVFGLPNLVVDGTFSHLCVPDSLAPSDVAFTLGQVDAFYSAAETLKTAGYRPGMLHLQASYAIWNLPPQPCDFARVGIALYGVRSDCLPVQRVMDLRPVLSLKARVAAVRRLETGECVGYGLSYQTERPTTLAVVSIGYADGLPRNLALCGAQTLIHGQRAPIVGRLCMDQMFVDVTDIPGVQSGDVVTLIGRDGAAMITAEQVAECCGTITNELLARLGHRLGTVLMMEKNARKIQRETSPNKS